MAFLKRIFGRDDDDSKGKGGTYAMPGPSPRRMRQVSPGTIDISSPMTPSRLPMVLESLGRGREIPSFEKPMEMMKKGGKVKKASKGGKTGYRRAADGCVQRGKTRGKFV